MPYKHSQALKRNDSVPFGGKNGDVDIHELYARAKRAEYKRGDGSDAKQSISQTSYNGYGRFSLPNDISPQKHANVKKILFRRKQQNRRASVHAILEIHGGDSAESSHWLNSSTTQIEKSQSEERFSSPEETDRFEYCVSPPRYQDIIDMKPPKTPKRYSPRDETIKDNKTVKAPPAVKKAPPAVKKKETTANKNTPSLSVMDMLLTYGENMSAANAGSEEEPIQSSNNKEENKKKTSGKNIKAKEKNRQFKPDSKNNQSVLGRRSKDSHGAKFESASKAQIKSDVSTNSRSQTLNDNTRETSKSKNETIEDCTKSGIATRQSSSSTSTSTAETQASSLASSESRKLKTAAKKATVTKPTHAINKESKKAIAKVKSIYTTATGKDTLEKRTSKAKTEPTSSKPSLFKRVRESDLSKAEEESSPRPKSAPPPCDAIPNPTPSEDVPVQKEATTQQPEQEHKVSKSLTSLDSKRVPMPVFLEPISNQPRVQCVRSGSKTKFIKKPPLNAIYAKQNGEDSNLDSTSPSGQSCKIPPIKKQVLTGNYGPSASSHGQQNKKYSGSQKGKNVAGSTCAKKNKNTDRSAPSNDNTSAEVLSGAASKTPQTSSKIPISNTSTTPACHIPKSNNSEPLKSILVIRESTPKSEVTKFGKIISKIADVCLPDAELKSLAKRMTETDGEEQPDWIEITDTLTDLQERIKNKSPREENINKEEKMPDIPIVTCV